MAKFKNSQNALLFNCGYSANTGAIPALSINNDTSIFSDELNHASIIDGIRLSKASTKYIYEHCNYNHLRELIEKSTSKHKIVISETLFSMDGDIANLNELVNICQQHNALLYLDDAHASGVLGEKGRGSLEHFNITPNDSIIQMGTLSKALGSCGGFICANSSIIEYLINTARPLIFSTALPAPVIASAATALNYIENHPEIIIKLRENISILRTLLNMPHPQISPIIPIPFNTIEDTLKASSYLYDNGIYAPAIRPPTVKTPRIRISISANHNKQDIEALVKCLSQTAR
ncbi:2-amino-3-ketobutyrate CoA ligase [Candidatus Magnetoovum chiemensis]|nr:2-amino-3-ketobutyrate CoA ligase [Candidatus Magnetoovum chiemensis]